MTKPKIFMVSFAALFALAVAAALILDRSGYLVRALKPEVVRALSVATGRPVEVKSVDGGIFGSIAIRGLSMGQSLRRPHPQNVDVSIRVDKAVVTFSLWDFFVRHMQASQSLRRLEFYDPVITLELGQTGINAAEAPPAAEQDLGALLAGFPLPPVETLVNGGRLELARGGAQPLVLLDKIEADLAFHALQGKAHLELRAASCSGTLKAQADFFPDTRTGSGELILSAMDSQKLADLPGLEGLHQFAPTSGQIQGRLKLKLVPPAPEQWMQGLSVQGGMGLKFGNDNLELALKDRQASLVLHKGLGRMEAEGWMRSVSGSTALDFKGLFLHFPISESGDLEGNFSIGGSLQSPLAQASLNCPQWKVGGETFNSVQADLNLNGQQLELKGGFSWRNFKELKLSAHASFDDTAFKLSDLQLTDSSGKRVLATGSASAARMGNHALQGAFELGPVESVDLLQAWGIPESVKGPVSAHLGLGGGLTAPEFRIKVAGPGVRTADGQAFGVSAELLAKGGVLTVLRAEARGGELSATGRWNLPEDSRIEITLKKAPLPVLAALGATQKVQPCAGSLDGRLNLLWGGRTEVDLGATDLDLEGFAATKASLKGSFAPRSWSIEKLSATQAEGGEIHAAALFDPKEKSEAAVSGSITNWRFGKFGPISAKLDVSTAKTGALKKWFSRATQSTLTRREIGGEFQLREFSCAGSRLPDLNGQWNWFERGELDLQDLNWGAGVSARANYKVGASWSAHASFKDADVLPLALLLNLDKESAAHQKLSAQFDGQGEAETARISIKMDPQFSAELTKASVAGGGTRWQGSANVKAMDLKRALELAALAGGEGLASAGRALSGNLNADLKIDSSMALPLSFSASVENFSVSRRDPLGNLNMTGQADAHQLRIDSLDLGISKSRLQLHDAILKTDEKGWTVDTGYAAQDFPDKAFFRFGGEGNLKLKVAVDSAQADLSWHELALNREMFGAGAAKITWKDRQLRVEDSTKAARYKAVLKIPQKGDVDLESLTAHLANNGLLEAHHSLDEEGKQRLEITGQAVEASLIAGILDWHLNLGGLAYGNAVLRLGEGPKGHMHLFVSAKVENGNLQGFPFDLATGSIRIEQGRLDLNPLGEKAKVRVIRHNRYEAEVWGTVPLDTDVPGKDPEQINMDAELLSGNLGMFDFIDLVDSGTGTVTAKVQVRGTARYPEFNGHFESRGGTLKFKRLLAPATDIQAWADVDTNRLLIGRLDAQMGGAGQRLIVEHGPASEAALTFDQWVLSTLNVNLKSGKAGVNLVANDNYEFVRGGVVPDLVLGGTWENPTLAGKLSLFNTVITYPPINKNPRPSNPDDFSERLLWKVLVNPGNKVLFTNNVARVEIQSDEKGVLLQGPGKDITLEGRIKPLRGRLSYLTSDFQIDDTKDNSIDFLGTQPARLDLWATRNVRSAQGFDTPIDVEITGNLGNVQMNVTSPNKDLTEAQRVSMAGLGVDSTGRDVSREQVLGAILGKFVVKQLTQRIKGTRDFDFSLRAPGLVRAMTGSDSQTGTADTMGNTLASKDIGEIEVGSYLPGSKLYGKAALGLKENAFGEKDPTYKYGVEMTVGKGQKVEAVTGNDETKLLYSAQTSMDNYDPRKRREMLEEKRLAKRATATPTPQTTLTPQDSNNP